MLTILAFLRAHGVPCFLAPTASAVVAFGEYVITGTGGHVWGYDVELIRSMREARAFCGY